MTYFSTLSTVLGGAFRTARLAGSLPAAQPLVSRSVGATGSQGKSVGGSWAAIILTLAASAAFNVAGAAVLHEPEPSRLPPALQGANLRHLSNGGYLRILTLSTNGQAESGTPRSAASLGAGSVALDPKVGPNVRLGDDPSALPANRRAQAEPHIIRSFSDPGFLVGTFQEGRFEDGGAVDCGYAVSTDGGTSWQRGLTPNLTTIAGGTYSRASDPVAALDLDGNIYLCSIALSGTPQAPASIGAAVVSKSSDRGQSFGQPARVFGTDDPSYFTDKDWIVANTFAGTPTANRLVVTFTYFSLTNIGGIQRSINPIVCSHSDDGGTNWSAITYVSPFNCQGSQPNFLPDGSLAIVYWNFDGPSGNQLEMALSADGGNSFQTPRVITIVPVPYADPVARSEGFLPSATADREAGAIYVAYQATRGASSAPIPAIMFARSNDKGLTWTTPRAVNDTPQRMAAFNPVIAVSPEGQHVSIAFYDKRNDDGSGHFVDLYLAESFDSGDTWGPNLRLTTVSSDLTLAPLTDSGYMFGDYQGLVPALNFQTPAFGIFIDSRTGSPDPFVVSITRTQGATFGAWQKLRFTPSELALPDVSGEAADPDHDGRPNLIEYALGTNPKAFDAAPALVAATSNGTNHTVSVWFDSLAVMDDVRFSWRSTDLASNPVQWQAILPANQQILNAPDPTLQRHLAQFSTAQDQLQFFGFGASRTNAVPALNGP